MRWNIVASLWILIAVSEHQRSLSAGIRQRCILSNGVWPIIESIIKNLLNGIQETPQKTQGVFDSPLSVMSHWEAPGSRQERMHVKATVQRAFFPRGPSPRFPDVMMCQPHSNEAVAVPFPTPQMYLRIYSLWIFHPTTNLKIITSLWIIELFSAKVLNYFSCDKIKCIQWETRVQKGKQQREP